MRSFLIIATFMTAGILFSLGISESASTTSTPPKDIPSSDCLDCHQDADEVGEENVVDAARFKGGPHVEDNGVYCSSCHAGGEAHMEEPGPMEPASCTECHEDVIQEFGSSAHATRTVRSDQKQPNCQSCHGVAHDIRYSKDQASPVNRLNQPKTCGGCHGGAILENYKKSIHGQMLLEGKEGGPTCSSCHGSHGILPADIKRSPQFKRQVLESCGGCHKEVFNVYKESVHGTAFLKGNITESATCADCHSTHEILPPSNPASTVYPTKIKDECAACHADARLIRRFGLPSDVVQTYERSYHGRAIGRGDTQVANCASCHHYHDIFAMKDPRSSVNPQNLAKTCGGCHPGAGPNFIAGKIHVTDAYESNPWARFISEMYVWMIVLIIGGMVIHNAFDFVRKMIIRNRQQKSEPHVIRMTLLERIMHAALGISFITLVYTGFALVWPSHWIFAPLNMISNSEAFRSTLHRICGVILAVIAVHHIWFLLFNPLGKEQRKRFMPRLRDVRDLWDNIMFYIGRRPQRPRFGRFTYMEKAEYWALVWGTAVMVGTGFILWFEDISLMFMPLWLWEVFRIVHFYEAILAALAILVWHFYYVMFNPDEAPLSLTFITGRMTHKELAKVHPEEFEEVLEAERAARKGKRQAEEKK
jgi:cytochrome b subunit of formate dehydrogenase/nitrate/TMAO reductase-like tetraheme cytochrome c subunit